MATVTWATPNTADQPTWSGSLTSLTSGSYSLSSAIDNSAGTMYENAIIEVVLPSAVTAGAGAPYLGFTILYAPDGTNYPTPPGGTAGATGMPQTVSIPAVASASFTGGNTPAFSILPFKFKIQLFQNLGVTLPGTGSFTVNVYRWAETVA